MVKMREEDAIKMRIKRIEKEIRDTPYHKATEHHIGMLRAKLSKLKDQVELKQSKKGGGGGGYAVKKQGDATIVLVGPPSVGKSTLINKLTNAKSKIAPYAFTTVTVIPGMMEYKDARIQILDVPGLIDEAEKGKGRGKEVLSVIRGSDLLILMCDVENTDKVPRIKNMLENSGIRIDKTHPDITIEKKLKGGTRIISNIKQDLGKETIKEVAKEFGYGNSEVTLRQKIDMDQLIDIFSRNRVYIPSITVMNKSDLKNIKLDDPKTLKISAEKGKGLDKLKEKIYKDLKFLRVFLVRTDEKPSYSNPIVMKEGDTLKDVAIKIGEDFAEEHERAKIWESGAKFPGQEVSLTTEVLEGMQVRFI
ncbi:50S ribosome-binding GTPase [Candidatus Woesebacteria bacterium]|nr:50S ribosome-binding GTPase [Candidatus Woesebacteria bacterium]